MSSPIKLWRNQDSVQKRLQMRGIIVSWTMIRVPPVGFENQAPYPVVIVEVGKSRYVGQLVDYDEKHLKIGQAVISTLRRLHEAEAEGIIPYGIKFKPLE